MPTTLIKNASDITLNTHHEVDQILGRPPGWILRWGITMVLLAVAIFSIMAWFVKYPDVIPAQVSIVTENPAIRVIAKANGKINQLRVENGDAVQEGQILAVLDNPAQMNDVAVLSGFLEELEAVKLPKDYLKIKPPDHLRLGSIQSSFATLAQKINDYRFFLGSADVFAKIRSLEKQIKYNKVLSENLSNQHQTLVAEMLIAEKDYKRNLQLNEQGVIADIPLEQSETQFLQYKRQIEGIKNQIVSNNITVEQLRTQIIDLKQNRKSGRSDRELTITEDIEKIKSEISTWKQNWLITAPIAGNISFTGVWSEQQFVNANDVVLTIVPEEGSGKIIAKVLLPIANSGKVAAGQTANIYLDGFPFQEYGIIKSKVGDISLVPVATEGGEATEHYLLHLLLSDTLRTTYDKVIPFRQEMKGTANIITEERRVLERIFDRLNSILKNT